MNDHHLMLLYDRVVELETRTERLETALRELVDSASHAANGRSVHDRKLVADLIRAAELLREK